MAMAMTMKRANLLKKRMVILDVDVSSGSDHAYCGED
jgi:hypothetical protein